MAVERVPEVRNLVLDIRASLNAKLQRLLARPLVASIGARSSYVSEDATLPRAFSALRNAAHDLGPSHVDAWSEDPDDGTCTVSISIDYNGTWRGCEKEVCETVSRAIENVVAILTEEQKLLLERSPCDFLSLSPRPENAELIGFEKENVGGRMRIIALRLATPPQSRAHSRYIAIVPNLVQIERQLDALHRVENATDDGPLGPLRALVGACDASALATKATTGMSDGDVTRLDEHQRECVTKAMSTPHFALIEGPPGSGKTTVITAIIRQAVAKGDRVLVVSPTHVAVDNVVEKLVPRDGSRIEQLERMSLPVRYATRTTKLSASAQQYWVGAKKQHRAATITRRVQARLEEAVPFAAALFEREDPNAAGHAPISSALARIESVICGTPIGILSFDALRKADVCTFDLLIVDEVSKMTLSEFLAIAVKARRWVVVGDPAQLPPYNDSEENGTTLDDVLSPLLELACSVGAILERTKPAQRGDERLVVVSSDPARAVEVITAHVAEVMPSCSSMVGLLGNATRASILVCACEGADRACELNACGPGRARLLIERGLTFSRNGESLVEPRVRAPALIFETSFSVYHAQPWGTRAGQRLRSLGSRNGLEKFLPTAAAMDALSRGGGAPTNSVQDRRTLIEAVAMRFAINTVSVYDWLTGVPTSEFDTSPLRELASVSNGGLAAVVRPFVGTLKKQYRMHASLSRVPRELFYFEEALLDGRSHDDHDCRAVLVHVDGDANDRESNRREVEAIATLLRRLDTDESSGSRPEIMVITPYREQEKLLGDMLRDLREQGALARVGVEICTLDRCQGREAEYVLLSLVRSRATPFLDMPKRWNVALTRGKEGLFIVGNIAAYLREAAGARRELTWHTRNARGRGETRPLMSLLARIIETYDRRERVARGPR
jgi:hypothetical protein